MNFGGERGLQGDKMASKFNSLAYGNVMQAAAENLKKEMLASERACVGQGPNEIDMEELVDDPELERIHRERMQAMKEEQEKRAKKTQKGHGTYVEVQEADFLPNVTGSDNCVVHFFHKDFERCRIVDRHLGELARKHFDTRFFKINAVEAPFFVDKLGVKVLPCIIMFMNGVAIDRIVGFEGIGGKDDFSTTALEKRFIEKEVVKPKKTNDDDMDAYRNNVVSRGMYDLGSDDESSDFSDDD